MTIGIIGLGLIGGSLGLSLGVAPFVDRVIGFDQLKDHRDQASALGLVDVIFDREELIKKSDVILLAIPVHHIVALLPEILNAMSQHQTILDFGSTKKNICETVRSHPKRSQFVAAHPMAGTENTGPSAAIKQLFQHKVNIICERELNRPHALEVAEQIFNFLAMKTIYMTADDHDKHIAYVSHISHISSFMLGLTVLDIEKDEKNIFNMAGSGFESTVRLAMSSPDMWAPILDQNARHVTGALDLYIQYLQKFREMVISHDKEGMKKLMRRANDIRKILKSTKDPLT